MSSLNICICSIWKGFHYPPESTSIILMARILASVAQSSDPDRTLANYMNFMHDVVSKKVNFDIFA